MLSMEQREKKWLRAVGKREVCAEISFLENRK